MVVLIDGVKYVPEVTDKKTVYDILKPLEGSKEWDENVQMIQKWFYNGYMSKTAWCATTITYALAMLGIRGKTMKERQENVYYMLQDFINTGTARKVDFKNETIKQGDIVFLDFGTPMTPTTSKHVTCCAVDTPVTKDTVPCIGGNQNDMIKTSDYYRTDIAAVYRPNY